MNSPIGQAGLVVAGAAISAVVIDQAMAKVVIRFKDNGKNFNKILAGLGIGAASYLAYSTKKGTGLNEWHLLMLGFLGGATAQIANSATSKVAGPPLLNWQAEEQVLEPVVIYQ